jgi:hypothetical protein
MNWRLDLSGYALHGVQLIDGEPAQAAVWTSTQDVRFYDVQNGAFYEARSLAAPPGVDLHDPRWPGYLETLRAPNGAFLPMIDTGRHLIHTSHDGRLRLYQDGDHSLRLEADGQLSTLPRRRETPLCAARMDRDLGTIAALSADGMLHLYQQHIYVGDYMAEGTDVLLPDATDLVYVVGEIHVRALDMAGQVQYTLDAPAAIGMAACSPDGRILVTGDRDQGMIRAYDMGLHPIRQGHTTDLLEQASPVQLLAALPPLGERLLALDVANDGTLVFALGNGVCLTHVRELAALPQPFFQRKLKLLC